MTQTSSLPQTPFYMAGGNLRADAPSYIERAADRQLLDALLAGEFCYMLDTRQIGKSSLTMRAMVRLRAAGITVVALDLTRVGTSATVEQWYYGLLVDVGRQIGALSAMRAFWQEQKTLGPLPRWMEALRQIGLASPDTRLVIFVDEIDAVRNLSFSTDAFFAGLRECYNRRALDPDLNRLTFCLLGTTTPNDLVEDARTTPFNIGTRILLTDFTLEEAAPLAKGLIPPAPSLAGEPQSQHGDVQQIAEIRDAQEAVVDASRLSALSPGTGAGDRRSESLLRRIHYWTNGHPYLTQLLCQTVAQEPGASSEQDVDRVCARLFFGQGQRESEINLANASRYLLKNSDDVAGVLDMYQRVLQNKQVKDEAGSLLCATLRLSGLARVEDGLLRVRNRIYARVFDTAWIRENMPNAELRRQQAAVRRARLRVGLIAGVIVLTLTIALLSVLSSRNQALAARQQADKQAKQIQAANANLQISVQKEQVARQQADTQKNRADQEARRAQAAATLAQQETQRALIAEKSAQKSAKNEQRLATSEARQSYSSNVQLLQQKFEKGNIGSAQSLLDQTRNSKERGFEWDYWRQQLNPQNYILAHEKKRLKVLQFAADGKRLLLGGDDGVVTVLDMATRQPAQPPASIGQRCLAFSHDGQRLLTTTRDSQNRDTFTLWHLDPKGELFSFSQDKAIAQPPRTAVFSPDDSLLALIYPSGEAEIRDAHTGQRLRPLKGHQGPIFSLAFSPDGKRLATSGNDNTARVWNLDTGQATTLDNAGIPVSCVSFSPDGAYLLTGDFTGWGHVYDAVSLKESYRFHGHTNAVSDAAYSQDSQHIVTTSLDGSVVVWSATTYQTEQTIPVLRGASPRVFRVLFAPDGQSLVTSAEDQTVRLWDLTSFWAQGSFFGGGFSPNGQQVVFGDTQGHLALLDASTRQEIKTLTTPPIPPQSKLEDHLIAEIQTVSFSSDGRWLLGTVGYRGGLPDAAFLWPVAGKQTTPRLTWKDVEGDAAFSPDSSQVYIRQGKTQGLGIWDVASGRKLRVVPISGQVMAFSPNARFCVTREKLPPIKPQPFRYRATVWSLPAGEKLGQIESPLKIGKTENPLSLDTVACSSDGQTVALSGATNSVALWKMRTGQLTLMQGHDDTVYTVAFSPDGKRVATGSGDTTVKLWDTRIDRGQQTSTPLLTIRNGAGMINGLAFSADGQRLLVNAYDGAKVWEAGPPKPTASQAAHTASR